MNANRGKRIVFSIATGGLLLVGLFALLKGAPEIARANPGDLFVTPGGSGDCSQGNPCDLQTALSAASDGDTVYMAQGTYTGTGGAVITITEGIALYGGWDGVPSGEPHRNPVSYTTRLDGEDVRRVVYITGSIAPVLDGLVITNGNAEGSGGYDTADAGGGIYINGGNALITDCTIITNSAGPASAAQKGTGGGVFLAVSYARLENNRIISNTARWGGGVRVVYGAPVFRHNQFLSNTSLFGGGAYLMGTAGLVEDNLFQGNTGERGGGLYLSTASSTVKRNLIKGNQGSIGGGIGINAGTFPVIVSGNRILENEASFGGGVSIQYNDAKLDNNFVAHNRALEGAGIRVEGAFPIFRHNTLARNTGEDGTGVFVGEDAAVVLTNTILVSHTVGITVTAGSTATLEGTLWGSGSWANSTNWGGDGDIFASTPNIWGDPAFVDPDGGDYHIGPDSAARNAGVNAGVTEDIDGDTRPQGSGYDIGADEFRQRYIYLPLVAKNYP
jgi:hypothetical protein